MNLLHISSFIDNIIYSLVQRAIYSCSYSGMEGIHYLAPFICVRSHIIIMGYEKICCDSISVLSQGIDSGGMYLDKKKHVYMNTVSPEPTTSGPMLSESKYGNFIFYI